MTVRPFVLNSNMPQLGVTYDYARLVRDIDRNTGNAYIGHALSKTIYGKPAAFSGVANLWQENLRGFDREQIQQGGYTHLFLMMKDYIRESFFDLPWEKLTRLVEQIDLPLVVFGLGANSFGGYDTRLHTKLPEAMRHCLQVLAERSISLGIRGEFTADVLSKLGITNVRLIGCPSYYEQGPDRQLTKAGWNPEFGILANGAFSSERYAKQLHYMIQDDVFVDRAFFKALLEPGALNEADMAMIRHPALRSYFNHAVDALEEGRMSLLIHFDAWKKFAASRFNLAIGGRLHGAIAAINAGIPAVVTNRDSRAREMCSLLGIPHMPELQGTSDQVDLERLYETLDIATLNDRYQALYTTYIDWLAEHAIHPAPTITSEEENLFDIRNTSEPERLLCARQIREKLIQKPYPLWLWYLRRATQQAAKSVFPKRSEYEAA